jgi:hypothetical protein
MNPNITFDIVKENPNMPWDWTYLSMNSNITWDIVKYNMDIIWDWSVISASPNMLLSVNDVANIVKIYHYVNKEYGEE